MNQIDPYKKITDLLKAKKISFTEIKHIPIYTMNDSVKATGISAEIGAKSLLLKSDEKYFLIVIRGSQKFDFKKLKSVLKVKKIRLATPQEVKDQMKCEIGACFPFGNIVNLPTYADISLVNNKIISFSPGLHTCSIKIKWEDFYALVKPKLENIIQEQDSHKITLKAVPPSKFMDSKEL